MSRKGKSIETGSRSVVSKGWRKGGLGSYCLLGAESGWDNEKVLEIEVVVAQHCEYNQHRITVYLKTVKWIHLCLYITTSFFKKDQKVTKQSLVIDF